MGRRRPLLYDHRGQPFATEPAWPSAGTGRRVRHWYPTSSSVNDLIAMGGIDLVRDRSRQEVRRNPWASRVLEVDAGFTVGTGMTPVLDLEDEQAERDWSEAWQQWSQEADADGNCDQAGLQWLVYHSAREGGDCFVRFRTRRRQDGFFVPLQLQVLEAELCDTQAHRRIDGGRVVRAGVEFDALGRRRAYWMFPNHPGESLLPQGESAPVPAEQIAHVFRVVRPGQVRGIPKLAGVLATLKEIEDTRDAHVLRKKIANLYVSWEKVNASGFSIFDSQDQDLEHPVSSSPETEDELYTPEAGDHHVLPPGHEVEFSKPPEDSEDFASFLKAQLRAVAAGAGVLYEHVSGDHESVNFSSIRTGLIMIKRIIEPAQAQMLSFQFCRPVWRRFVETAVLAGVLPMPEDARDARRLLSPKWQGPGWEYVEPEKDVRTAVRKVRAGLSSREREAAKLGIDVEQLDREIARDNARAKALGLVFDTDAGATTQSGVGQATTGTGRQLDEDADRERIEEEEEARAHAAA